MINLPPLSIYLHPQYCYLFMIYVYTVSLNYVRKYILNPADKYIDIFMKHEPEGKKWFQIYNHNVSYCTTLLGTYKMFYLSNYVYCIPFIQDFDTFVRNRFQEYLENNLAIPEYDNDTKQIPEILETLLVTKNDGLYTFRRCNPAEKSQKQDYHYETTLSDVEFIFVTYNHPKMYRSIQFDIPPSYFIVNNEILSPSFIQRYLELQKECYYFDEDYTIEILDNECEQQTLHYNNYIVIEKSSYKIMSNESTSDVHKPLHIEESLHSKEEEEDSKEEEEDSKEEEEDSKEECVIVSPKEASKLCEDEKNDDDDTDYSDKSDTSLDSTYNFYSYLPFFGNILS